VREQRSFWDYNEMGIYFYTRQAYDLAVAEFEPPTNSSELTPSILTARKGDRRRRKSLAWAARP